MHLIEIVACQLRNWIHSCWYATNKPYIIYRVYHIFELLLLRWVYIYLGENQFFFSEPSEIENSNKSLLKWKLGKSFVENWKGYFLLHAQMLLWKELKRRELKLKSLKIRYWFGRCSLVYGLIFGQKKKKLFVAFTSYFLENQKKLRIFIALLTNTSIYHSYFKELDL